jgi:3-hydroxybutyryl-CoA dehydrogenase
VNRHLLEVSLISETDRAALAEIASALGTPFEVTADQPGMVSARVVCMIVNEAFCTIEDGTATPANIDVAMKLGTNYPHGPVEWGRKIGLRNVCDVLSALYRETSDDRYMACELLRQEANRE